MAIHDINIYRCQNNILYTHILIVLDIMLIWCQLCLVWDPNTPALSQSQLDSDGKVYNLHSDSPLVVCCACKTDLLICSTRAAFGDEGPLYGCTLEVLVEQSYMMATISSETQISFLGKLSQSELKPWHTSVASSNTFQACHAVTLPFTTHDGTASQPVHA